MSRPQPSGLQTPHPALAKHLLECRSHAYVRPRMCSPHPVHHARPENLPRWRLCLSTKPWDGHWYSPVGREWDRHLLRPIANDCGWPSCPRPEASTRPQCCLHPPTTYYRQHLWSSRAWMIRGWRVAFRGQHRWWKRVSCDAAPERPPLVPAHFC